MTQPLDNVRKAARKRDRTCTSAYKAYVAAIRDAHDAGHTLQEIADAAGLKTRGGVGYLIHNVPDPRNKP